MPKGNSVTPQNYQGMLRLLICDRSNMAPIVSISKESFLLVEDAFHLNPATIPSLFRHEGICFKHINYEADSDRAERVDFVVKAWQKVEVANYLLSLSHHLPTGVTTAFICGDGAMEARSYDREAIFDHILALIRSSPSLWTNPMFLPTVLLQNHWRRTEHLSRSLEAEVIRMEGMMGVSCAGGTAQMQAATDWPMNIDVRAATIGVHTAITQTIFVGRLCGWSCKFAAFLLKTNRELRRIDRGGASALTEKTSRQLLETIGYVDDAIDNTAQYVQGMKERVHAQANVVRIQARERGREKERNLGRWRE